MRAILLLTLFFYIGAFAQIPTAGLDGHYSFTNGSLSDSNGGNHLTRTGTSMTTIADRFSGPNNAVAPGGDYLQRNSLQGLSQMSISFWVKTGTNDANIRTIIDQTERTGAGNTSTQKGWYAYLRNGKIGLYCNYRFNYQNTSGTTVTGYMGYYDTTSPTNIADNNWHHIVIGIKSRVYFWQGSYWMLENEYKIYIDNVLVNTYLHNKPTYSTGWANEPDTFPNVPVTIGNNRLGNLTATNNYSDAIDDIRIYKGNNLTNANINSLFLESSLTRFYVNAGATGANNGSSWANAYTSLQSALSAVTSQDIWIAAGIYKPHASDRNASFAIPSGITVYGGFNGTETQLSQRNWRVNQTVLSGDLLGNDDATLSFSNTLRDDNSYHLVKANANNITLDGLVFSNAHANGTATADKSGAAVVKAANVANITVKNCVFRNNVSLNAAAGIFGEYNTTATSSLNVQNCEFKDNLATYATSCYAYTNANITLNVAVYNSLFENNKATDNGTAKGYAGSAGWFRAYNAPSTVNATLTNNTYVNNLDTGTNAALVNRATIGFEKRGTAIMNGEINNCVFWNNKELSNATAKAANRIVDAFPNAMAAYNSLDSDNFSAITTKQNIVTTDPLFAGISDFQLSSGSPAVDSGDNTKVPATAISDLLGNNRILNTVDMGVYEFNSTLGNTTFSATTIFRMYPNPVTSILNVQSEELVNRMEVYSLEGQLVKESAENKMDVSNLQSGFYIIKVITDDNKTGVGKFIKK
nr:T9SS type A sorting domain-containing protein [uncultured Flavobacterium sp.]